MIPKMAASEEVFISYSQESVEHSERVLALSDRLRGEGVDCVLDQYEVAPPEGWPRWMDKKIRDAKYVLLVCTEAYFKRVMGEEELGKGHGVRWEGNLIYQHFYNSGTLNQRFIPVVFDQAHQRYIPTPLQGATYYNVATSSSYEDLYRRLTDQPKVRKPPLGKRRALPKKEVRTNPRVFLSSPIDVDLWDEARWSGTFVAMYPGKPPVLGLAFRNEAAACKIFEGWRKRYGNDDQDEELRIAIIEGPIKGEDDGYSVHIGFDRDEKFKRFRESGYEFDEGIFVFVDRINRMNPEPGSNNLEMFKSFYQQYEAYFLAPGVISPDGRHQPLLHLGILKRRIFFRNVSEIGKDDIDAVVLDSGRIRRPRNVF